MAIKSFRITKMSIMVYGREDNIIYEDTESASGDSINNGNSDNGWCTSDSFS